MASYCDDKKRAWLITLSGNDDCETKVFVKSRGSQIYCNSCDFMNFPKVLMIVRNPWFNNQTVTYTR